MDRRVRIGADGSVVLEHFRFSSNRENALSPCFYAFPDGKPLRTFPGNALAQLPQFAGPQIFFEAFLGASCGNGGGVPVICRHLREARAGSGRVVPTGRRLGRRIDRDVTAARLADSTSTSMEVDDGMTSPTRSAALPGSTAGSPSGEAGVRRGRARRAASGPEDHESTGALPQPGMTTPTRRLASAPAFRRRGAAAGSSPSRCRDTGQPA
jgi:hypothetical protein